MTKQRKMSETKIVLIGIVMLCSALSIMGLAYAYRLVVGVCS